MTVLCVNSGITYADIIAADAAESGNSYGVPTRYEQSGTSTGNVQFINADYPDSFIYTAAVGEESTGVIGVGAKCDGNITTTVTDGAITNLNTGVINVVNANSAYLRKLVVDAGGGTIDGVLFNDTTDAEDILVYNCNDGFLSNVLVNNSLIKKCTVIGATRFGFAQGKFTDCVDVNSSNQGYFNEAGASSGTWEHDGTGTNTIAESPATDIFEDFDGGDYRIKATSSPGLAGAGAFINSGGGNDVILDVDNGAFSLSGSDVLFMASRIEQALTGNYNLSGSDINFSIGYAINLDGGIYSLSGSATGLVLNANTVIESGEYSLAGTQANLDIARKSIIESGSYNLTGSDVTLIYTPGGTGESLFIDSGAFSLTGSDIGLKSTRLISVNSGIYNLTGQQISLTYNAKTIIDSGSYALIGSNVNLFANRVIIAVNGSYTLSGTSVILKYSGDTYKTIGTVTAGFAQDRYSAEYKPTTITVNFKD